MNEQDICNQLGISDASEAVRQKALGSIIALVYSQFISVVDEIMSDDQKAEFERVASEGEPEEIIGWLKSNVQGAAEVYEALLKDQIDSMTERLG